MLLPRPLSVVVMVASCLLSARVFEAGACSWLATVNVVDVSVTARGLAGLLPHRVCVDGILLPLNHMLTVGKLVVTKGSRSHHVTQ